MTNILTSKTN